MATKIRIEFISEGFREVLMSDGCSSFVNDIGSQVAQRAGDGFIYRPSYLGYGGGRMGGYVVADTYEAMVAEATDKVLSRAAGIV